MSVYVDWLQPCIATTKWRHKESCHLMADTLADLHSFAEKIGLKFTWFQNHPRHPHYDLTKNKRCLAVAMGAVEVDLEWYKKKRLTA